MERLQEYPVNIVVSQGSILGHEFFLLYPIDLSDDSICIIAISADNTTFYSTYDQAPDFWHKLELTSELQFDLWDIVDWDRKWLVDFDTEKTQLVEFGQSNDSGVNDVKMCISAFEEKFLLWSFFLMKLLFISVNLPYGIRLSCLGVYFQLLLGYVG